MRWNNVTRRPFPLRWRKCPSIGPLLWVAALFPFVFSFPLIANAQTRPNPGLTNSLQNPLVAPSQCAECHEFLNPFDLEDEPPVSPMLVWRGTMMANAARDPVFWAGVAVASQDVASDSTGHLSGATRLCIRCHSPRAFVEGNADATHISELSPAQREGIECDFCHRMIDHQIVSPGNASFVLDDLLVGEQVPRRGPWAYDLQGPEHARPEHSTIQDSFTGTSKLCGTCHDVTTPNERIDNNGIPTGVGFNEQRTYSEWLGSDYAQPGEGFRSCQDCHMPAIENAAGCQAFFDANDPTLLHATGARRHDFIGANRFMLQILNRQFGQGEVPSEHFNLTMALADNSLHRSAGVEIDTVDHIDLRQGLPYLNVTITNRSGHKLPSGYTEGRIMWIEVTAIYEKIVLFSSGAWDSQLGRQEDEQLHEYQAIAERLVDGKRLHLLLNDHWVIDDRIPPRGLRPNPETDPVGHRYTLQENGQWPHYDTASYQFAGRDDVDDQSPDSPYDFVNLHVRLLYLINTPEYVEFLRKENTLNDSGETLHQLFETAGGAEPVVLGKAVVRLPLTGLIGQPEFPPDEPTSSTSSDTGDTGTVDSSDTEGNSAPPSSEPSSIGCACQSPSRKDSNPPHWAFFALGCFLYRTFRRQT